MRKRSTFAASAFVAALVGITVGVYTPSALAIKQSCCKPGGGCSLPCTAYTGPAEYKSYDCIPDDWAWSHCARSPNLLDQCFPSDNLNLLGRCGTYRYYSDGACTVQVGSAAANAFACLAGSSICPGWLQ